MTEAQFLDLIGPTSGFQARAPAGDLRDLLPSAHAARLFPRVTWARRRQIATGQTFPVFAAGLGLIVGTPLLTLLLLGIPLRAWAIRKLDAETFRRLCMSFDVWVVGFGLSRVLVDLKLAHGPLAYGPMALAIVLDVYLLYVFFSNRSEAKSSLARA